MSELVQLKGKTRLAIEKERISGQALELHGKLELQLAKVPLDYSSQRLSHIGILDFILGFGIRTF